MHFGVFLGPYHPPEGNTTLDIGRDLELIEWLDELGYDEAFIGEHHSSGWEIIGSPEVFIAAAAERTKTIKLGTGVVSLPYHHPFMVAERLVLLDHLTKGRVIMGVGPGALPSDAAMIGLKYGDLRDRMEEALEAIVALLTEEGHVNRKTDWFELVDAQLQLKPYSKPRFEICLSSLVSPAGPRLAGKMGLPILTMANFNPDPRATLRSNWAIMEEEAALAGHPKPQRSAWRLTTPVHVAQTREQAEAEVQYGLEQWAGYALLRGATLEQLRAGLPPRPGATILDVIRERDIGVIGTPEDAIAHIERMQEASGGYGCHLLLCHDWADRQATKRSLELFAEQVVPRFQSSSRRRIENAENFMRGWGEQHLQVFLEASQQAADKYASEREFR